MSALASVTSIAPERVTFAVTPERLSSALAAVNLFASTDVARFHICGVALAIETGCLTFVATNAYALARVVPVDCALAPGRAPVGPDRILAIIPLDAAKNLAKRAKDQRKVQGPDKATLDIERGFVVYRFNGEMIEIKCVDSDYPPYKAVICDKRVGSASGDGCAAQLIALDPRYLVDACNAARLFGMSKGQGLEISIPEGPLDPVRLDAHCSGCGELTVIVMPMRAP